MEAFDRIGLAVHPRRELDSVLATIHEWAQRQGAEIVQVAGRDREVAPAGDAADCDLVIALGGDGTALAALHAAAPAGKPVLGVACGSLGALTATTADKIDEALSQVAAGDWKPSKLPGLGVEREGEETIYALNDLVLIRDGAGQVTVEVGVDGERYVRFSGDGLVVGTPLGSTAYNLASGGPMLAPGVIGLVLTPLSPHGGVCPPLVAAIDHRLDVELDPGFGGARIETDGQVRATLERLETVSFRFKLLPDYATLVVLGEDESMIAGLRRRGIILDSPRVRAREARSAPTPY